MTRKRFILQATLASVLMVLVTTFQNCSENLASRSIASGDVCWAFSGEFLSLTSACAGKVGIGTSSPASALHVAGVVTASNLNQAPVFSMPSSSVRFSTSVAGSWAYTGESLTLTVPPDEKRKFRISMRQMAFSNVGGTAIFTLSTSNSSLVGVPAGIGLPYNPIIANTWTSFNTEGYVSLNPGTYTYYVMVLNSTAGTLQVANSTSDNGNYSTVIAWPL